MNSLAIAKTLRSVKPDMPDWPQDIDKAVLYQWESTVNTMANTLEKETENFNRSMFYSVCEYYD